MWYTLGMTKLLQQAMQKMAALPEATQEALPKI
jgi:hypothetical protein